MPYRTDPKMSGRHPFEIFMMLLGAVTGLPTLLGVAPKPGTIEEALPGWAVTSWCLTLVIGCSLVLIGIFIPRRDNGLVLEQLGLALAGVAALIYAACAIWAVGSTAAIPAGIIFGFGASCLIRWHDLQDDIERAHVEDERRKAGGKF